MKISQLPTLAGRLLGRLGLFLVASAIITSSAHAAFLGGINFGTSTDYKILSLGQTDTSDVPGLTQAIADGETAARFAYWLGLDPAFASMQGYQRNTSFGNTTITTNTTISLSSVGKYVFTLGGIDFGSSTSTLTINAPVGSKVVFYITGAFLVNKGNILVGGGLKSNDVIYRLVGSEGTGIVSGGKVQGTILAAKTGRNIAILGNSTLQGRAIGKSVLVSTGAVISPEF